MVHAFRVGSYRTYVHASDWHHSGHLAILRRLRTGDFAVRGRNRDRGANPGRWWPEV